MKRFLLLTSSLVLMVPEVAMAQAGHHPPGGSQNRPPSARPPQDRPPQVRPPVARPPEGRPPGTRPPGVRPPSTRPPHTRPPQVRPPVARPPHARPPHRPGYRPPNFRPIAGPAYRYPRGYGYRRWRAGLLIPAIFLSQAYYYDNYYNAGFGSPPRGYRWVRYGPDLLLVNLRTRRIADVIYNVFR
ncbi:RcnB family protein [Sphingomonas koreensis]